MILLHGNREIDGDAVDYGDMVMIRYLDTDELAIVPKTEITFSPSPPNGSDSADSR